MMIVLFDGVCNLCNRSVDFVVRRAPPSRIRVAAQQSPTGQRLLTEAGLKAEAAESLIVLDGTRTYMRSDAALQIVRRLRTPWPLLYGFVIVPRVLRDPLYTLIARHRYRLFGRRNTCRLPSDADRAHFLE